MGVVAILLTTWLHCYGEESVCGLNFSLLVSCNYPSPNTLCLVRLVICTLNKTRLFILVLFLLNSTPVYSPPLDLPPTRKEIAERRFVFSSYNYLSFNPLKDKGQS